MLVYIILGFAIIFNALANILIKIGMLKSGQNLTLTSLVSSFFNPLIFLGIACFALALIAYAVVLSRLNLSIAYPIMTSLGFLIVISVSALYLGEALTVAQIIGFILILIGVWLVAG
jgi:multidrug transporter EmrE-like cation transporter